MAGLRSVSQKTKRSDRTLTGATLGMETLGQCGESTLRDFKPSCLNHGNGQLTKVERNRLTVSNTVSIDEPAGGYMEKKEYRNSARGHLIALEKNSAIECYLQELTKGTTRKQKAYGTFASSEIHTETVEQTGRRRNANYCENTSSNSITVRNN